MPPKAPYFITVSPTDVLRVRITTHRRGRGMHFTVQHETYIDGEWFPVARCDPAHGQAHIDFLDHRGRPYRQAWLGYFYPFDDAYNGQ